MINGTENSNDEEPEYWCSASMRIISKSLTIEDITSLLDTKPTRAFSKGDEHHRISNRIRKNKILFLRNQDRFTNKVSIIADYYGASEEEVRHALEAAKRFDKRCLGSEFKFIWILDSGLGDSEAFEKHLEAFLSFIEKKEKEIKTLENSCVIELLLGIRGRNIYLSHLNVERIAKFGIDISVNLYLDDKA